MNRIFYEIKEQMGLGKRKITLRQSYRTTTAYVTGIHRPCVVVNADHFSEKEMRVVFAHELTHVVHNDIWFRYLLAVASILNFFNPVIWIFTEDLLNMLSMHVTILYVCQRMDYMNIMKQYLILL